MQARPEYKIDDDAFLKESFSETKRRRTPRRNIYFFEVMVFGSIVVLFGASIYYGLPWFVSAFLALCFVAGTMSIRIAQNWEKVVVLRLGKFNRIAGPGLFFIIPFVESAALRVDQRIQATPFSAEEALTADLVPTDIDAVLFWVVRDPKNTWCEVNDYQNAVLWSSQTALRDAVGQTNLANISTHRYQLDQDLKATLNAKISDWGIEVISVEIRNILIPEHLQEAMSREAQAIQESSARVILAETEAQVADLLISTAGLYGNKDYAFQLRMASMLNESLKESESGLVVVPSAYSEGFNYADVQKMLGK